jgi:multimeric flavodoxin WrbA
MSWLFSLSEKKGDNCPIKDDISKLKEKFNEADGFVFISPVYIRMISAQMKQLFDRMSFLLHRPVHAGKPAILICTSSYAGARESLNYLKIPVGNMGMHIVDSIKVLSSAYKKKTSTKIRFSNILIMRARNMQMLYSQLKNTNLP